MPAAQTQAAALPVACHHHDAYASQCAWVGAAYVCRRWMRLIFSIACSIVHGSISACDLSQATSNSATTTLCFTIAARLRTGQRLTGEDSYFGCGSPLRATGHCQHLSHPALAPWRYVFCLFSVLSRMQLATRHNS